MCNLYTYKLSAWEVRNLMEHRKLIGTNFPGSNDPPPERVYPDYVAPVIVHRSDGKREVHEMRWGFPPFESDPRVRTNVRWPKSKPWIGKWELGQRCLAPAIAFSEYQDGPSPKALRWFARADGKPFYLAATWMPWTGVRGKKSAPVEGDHELFTFLTTDANKIVKPVHSKAMPVILTTDAEIEQWLMAPTSDEALELQRAAPDDLMVLLPLEDKTAAERPAAKRKAAPKKPVAKTRVTSKA